tara:strand:- start:1296 stop:2198 length:903 start_codon:yes stop_codon:yes gene_type:complete
VNQPSLLWQFDLDVPSELEESFIWKLEKLGISAFAFKARTESQDFLKLSLWLPYNDFSIKELEEIMLCFIPLAEAFKLVLPNPKWKKIDEEDWSLTWKKYWKPDHIGRNLLILPEWIETPKISENSKIIRIDPGSAFGTGSHPSTRLCLESLDREPPNDLYVADIGCGSGILGLTALAFGAKKVFSVDIDSLAVSATKRNLLLNDFPQDSLSVYQGSIDRLKLQVKEKSIDLLFCNILAPVIKQLIPDFNEVISQKGKAFLSGILIDQVKDLEQTLFSWNWKVSRRWTKSNWSLIEIYRC